MLFRSSNVLTSSVLLGTFYGGGYLQVPQPNSGFNNPLPFNIQPGDQFRFESNESKVYLVISSSYDQSSKILYVYLDNSIQTGLNVNDFSIRRLVDDPGFVILNTPNTSGPGFIIPKYMSPTLKKNLPNIIANLSSKGLIP